MRTSALAISVSSSSLPWSNCACSATRYAPVARAWIRGASWRESRRAWTKPRLELAKKISTATASDPHSGLDGGTSKGVSSGYERHGALPQRSGLANTTAGTAARAANGVAATRQPRATVRLPPSSGNQPRDRWTSLTAGKRSRPRPKDAGITPDFLWLLLVQEAHDWHASGSFPTHYRLRCWNSDPRSQVPLLPTCSFVRHSHSTGEKK